MTDFSSAAKGAKRLTLGLGENLGRRGSQAGRTGGRHCGKTRASPTWRRGSQAWRTRGHHCAGETDEQAPNSAMPLQAKKRTDQDKLFKNAPVNNTDIDRAAQKREAANRRRHHDNQRRGAAASRHEQRTKTLLKWWREELAATGTDGPVGSCNCQRRQTTGPGQIAHRCKWRG